MGDNDDEDVGGIGESREDDEESVEEAEAEESVDDADDEERVEDASIGSDEEKLASWKCIRVVVRRTLRRRGGIKPHAS